MKQFIGYSLSGDCKEALQGLQDPKAIVIIAGREFFEEAVKDVAEAFPDVPSIGCVGKSYAETHVNPDGVTIVAFHSGVIASAGVIPNVKTMPLASIKKIEEAMEDINADSGNTICLDFTCGNDEELVSTLNMVLRKREIPLVGGTAWDDIVSLNGKIYENAAVFMFIKNLKGRIKAYRENLYGVRTPGLRYIATRVDEKNGILYEMNGKRAMDIYELELMQWDDNVADWTYENPLGRYVGDEVYLISLKDKAGDGGITCYKKVNEMDILTIMQLGDYQEIVNNTLLQIHGDFQHPSGIFSINCNLRYQLFEQRDYVDEYFTRMNALAGHAGLIGLGEHYNTQHVNQTMSAFVFE